ncbi:tight adherence protein B [Cryobacterium flavum]|uniref:Tight adherence protein B n=1 Tax=Cryobacterium flavum TaxID=1424659 RepID=A0A4R8UY20_9MICO|nr:MULTISPECIES: type II secretion system F family protein [Cryobacterium]TFB74457.1 type II secretion system protein F [Cryobacterium flavum]SDN16751.1 tight adherence protein B [Cryobacterium flavum]
MSTAIFAFGVLCVVAALLVVVLLVIAPPMLRVPLDRRRAPGAVEVSGLTRLTDRTVGAIDRVIRRRNVVPFTAAELEQAGIRMQPSAFVLMVISAAAVAALLGLLLGDGTVWMVPLMILFAALAVVGAKVWLRLRTGHRRAKFADQLDESLGLLAGGLRAGHSLMRAVDAVSHETEQPTSDEFARIVNETRIGRDLSDSLESTAVRMRSEDFQWVAQAISINREAGGNLSEVLDQVGHTIRERNQVRRQVKSLAAEGKLSAWVLVLLPIGVFAFLLISQPNYFNGFLGNIIGIIAIIVAAVLLIVGSLWMMAVVKVKF